MTQGWSESDKRIAKAAIDRAWKQAEDDAVKSFKSMPMKSFQDLWNLELTLHKWRREFGSRFDFSYQTAEQNIRSYIKRGWISSKDLQGLSEARLNRILK